MGDSGKIPDPVPLKHHTETAYLILLGLVIALAGIAAALLPPYPVGMPYWAILITLAALYPVVLSRTFRTNRADYEFRVLHWFPVGIFTLWLILELAAPHATFLNILKLGFFFLWSLPLVALGIAFIIIFAVHVLRRSRMRVTVLSLLLIFFTVGALAAEAQNLNPRLQAALFPKELPDIASVTTAFNKIVAMLAPTSGTGSKPVAMVSSSSSGGSSSRAIAMAYSSSMNSSQSSVMAFVSSVSSAHSVRSSLPPIAQEVNPGKLPSSGPEDIALLAVTLMGLYFGVVHARARSRA